jgi:hypothetical protein
LSDDHPAHAVKRQRKAIGGWTEQQRERVVIKFILGFLPSHFGSSLSSSY